MFQSSTPQNTTECKLEWFLLRQSCIINYRIGQKFGKRKVWQNRQILPNCLTLFIKNFAIMLTLSVF